MLELELLSQLLMCLVSNCLKVLCCYVDLLLMLKSKEHLSLAKHL